MNKQANLSYLMPATITEKLFPIGVLFKFTAKLVKWTTILFVISLVLLFIAMLHLVHDDAAS